MKNILSTIALATTITVFYTGCGASGAAKVIQPKIKLAESSEITNNINKYTDGLDNLNELMIAYNSDTINLGVLPVENKTSAVGKLPNDITLMVNSALNEIGEKVSVYMLNEKTVNNAENLNLYFIEGAITEYDVLEKTKRGANAGLKLGKGRGSADLDGSSEDDDELAKLTIDFNLINATTGAYVSKVHTSNSIEIKKKSASNDFGFSILGSGFGLSASAAKSQGTHKAIRLLVDLSMIELIGKFEKYPYWICVPGSKPDRRLLKQIRRIYQSQAPEFKKDIIEVLLGIINPNNVGSKAIIEYKSNHGIIPINDDLTTELYISLLENAQKIRERENSANSSNVSYKDLL